jgi:hypothetical protein
MLTDPTARDAYAAAIQMLRQTFLLAAERPETKMTALLFPIMLPTHFMKKFERP